jgi:hypothetical protein
LSGANLVRAADESDRRFAAELRQEDSVNVRAVQTKQNVRPMQTTQNVGANGGDAANADH